MDTNVIKIDIKDVKKLYFISDTHFGHSNIIKFCNRPYSNVDEQDNDIIEKWNNTISDDDFIFHLGDFFFRANNGRIRSILDKLNGKKYLILGNHDKSIIKNKWTHEYFENIYQRCIIDITNNKLISNTIVLDHYPICSWYKKNRGSLHLHGHVHNNQTFNKPNMFNVSVEMIGYKPISYNEIIDNLKYNGLYI
jgi:calcineurin-like phosphoesterase family protein